MGIITYRTGNDLDLDDFIGVYRESTLGERRPVNDRAIMSSMLQQADLIVTAWDGIKLIGISRTLTDFANVAYLADLAVHTEYQRSGIGRTLVQKTQDELAPTCSIVLLASPKANAYYPKIGFSHCERAWTLD